MQEKYVKRFHEAARKAALKHCTMNEIPIAETKCTIISEGTNEIIFSFHDKEIIKAQLIDEPKIKIKKWKP